MDRYVVTGNPVEHSQSPFIHAEFARQTGQTLDYGRLLIPLDDFAATVQGFAAGSLGDTPAGPARGCNVTVPFKFEAFALAARHTARAELAQACNTLRFDSGPEGWLGDNTDGAGLVADIERNAGVVLRGRRILLIGAGGAAAGVLGPLLATQPAELVVANRTVDKAQALVARHAAVLVDIADRTTLRAAPLADCGEGFDVVVNGTASSLAGAAPPVAARVLKANALALDMMYGPAAQGFLAWAASCGAQGRDGLGMLVEQAAEAFLLWRGVRPDTTPVLAALRARLAQVTKR